MKKVALITGANRGLGLETARQLAEAGATAIVGARDSAKGEDAAGQLRREGLDVESVTIDVDDASSVEASAEWVRARHGHLDILVNNAGIAPEASAGDTAGEVLDVEMFRRTFDTNVFGAVAAIQWFLPLLRKSQAGRIVNVSTTMGSLSEQLNPSSPYFEAVVPAYQARRRRSTGSPWRSPSFSRTPRSRSTRCAPASRGRTSRRSIASKRRWAPTRRPGSSSRWP